MRDWIVGLQKAAIEVRGGIGPDEWQRAEEVLGRDAPGELRELYTNMNGASFASGVVLFPLEDSGEARGALELSRRGDAGFPPHAWRFGRRDQEHLAAVRKRQVPEVDGESVFAPDWLDALSDDDWVFVARDEATREVRLYRTLEQLLTARIPPAHAEDFGDRTYARAMSLVETALTELGSASDSEAVKELVDQVLSVRSSRRPGARKKAAAKKRPGAAKNAVAKKRQGAAKKGAAKKRPGAARKPAAKKGAAKKKSTPKKGSAATKRTPAKKRASAKGSRRR